ncbi:MAG TPA: putative Ig domain-containing protein [Steroidobacteraceae bacterium]|nr:putative Ig domain-containing protein [Steroidobacteraceae bacterium]
MRTFNFFADRRRFHAAVLGLIGSVAALEATASTWQYRHRLSISGTPATSDVAQTAYSFKPTTSAPRYTTLAFSISGKPAWANFNTQTGQLAGTPTTTNVGKYSNIVITVSDGSSTASLPPFSISVTSPAPVTPPTISGQPPTSVNVGATYTFTPSATDSANRALTFSIQNAPSWATFNTSTGQVSGTPSATYVGTYSNIVISVSDGTASASLTAFSIAVNQISNGSATVNWTPPTSNSDGSSLTNLAGYRIHYGTASNSLTQSVQVANVGLTSYTLTNLTGGTWYFGVSAYTSSGQESALSNVVSKQIQ